MTPYVFYKELNWQETTQKLIHIARSHWALYCLAPWGCEQSMQHWSTYTSIHIFELYLAPKKAANLSTEHCLAKLNFAIFLLKSSWILYYAQELQHAQLTGANGSLLTQSVTRTPSTPCGLVVLRRAQTSSGIDPTISLSLRKAIPVCINKVCGNANNIVVRFCSRMNTNVLQTCIWLTQIAQLSHLAWDSFTQLIMINLKES